MNPEEISNNVFGYKDFRPAQKEIIETILAGYNVLGILPTGGGKSLCYQIPALMSDTFSIVISPLIALMKDQVDSLNKKEKVAAYINSMLTYKEVNTILNNLSNKRIKLLYVAPEKLDNTQFAETIKSLKPSYLFVDEAHCISEWGHNFRPSYRKIKNFAEHAGIKKISAFTATATEDVRKDIIEQLGMIDAKVFVYGFERENLNLNVIRTKEKKEQLLKLISPSTIPAIIYAATRSLTEEIHSFLKVKKINSAYYHAGLNTEIRRLIQDDFLNGRINIIIATNAFGMGIDKSNIRTIIHFNIPANIESYYQEIGRAGRDGKISNAYLLFDEKDISIQEFFIKSSYPQKEQIEIVYNAICDYGNIPLGNVSKKDIPLDSNLISFLQTKEINNAIIESSIRILEESGYIKYSPDYYANHKIQFIIEPDRLNYFIGSVNDNELKDFILLLVRYNGRKIFQIKTIINLKRYADILGTDLDLLIENLKMLSNSGIIFYEPPSIFPTVNILKPRVRSEHLFIDYSNTKRLIEHSRNKLAKMIDYVKTNECRFSYILKYFGEVKDNYKCGRCDNCNSKTKNLSCDEYIKNHIIQTLGELNSINKKDLFKILLGRDISYQNISTYGSCEHYTTIEIDDALFALETEKIINVKNDMIYFDISKSNLYITKESTTKKDYEKELMLFNKLRQIRKEVAEKFNQSAQMICPDNVLREIAKLRPKTFSELLIIDGFNKRMYNKIGEDFISAIKGFERNENINSIIKEKNLPQSTIQIYELIQKRYSFEDIVSITHIPESILSVQIETLIEAIPSIQIDSLFEQNELRLIYKKIDEGFNDIRELRKELNEKISNAKLRIALAKKRKSR